MNDYENFLWDVVRLLRRFDRKRILSRTFIAPGRRSMNVFQGVIDRRKSYVSRYEQKIRSPLDIELKLTILEILNPEEMQRYLMLNVTRLSTYEVVKLKVMTFIDAKTALRISDVKTSQVMDPLHLETWDQKFFWMSAHCNRTEIQWRLILAWRCSLCQRMSKRKGEGSKDNEGRKRVPDHWPRKIKEKEKQDPRTKVRTRKRERERERESKRRRQRQHERELPDDPGRFLKNTDRSSERSCEIDQNYRGCVNSDMGWIWVWRCSILVSLTMIRDRFGRYRFNVDDEFPGNRCVGDSEQSHENGHRMSEDESGHRSSNHDIPSLVCVRTARNYSHV